MRFKFTAHCRQYLSDIDTPVSIYLKIREHFSQCLLLESSEKHTNANHYSYVCFEPVAGITVNDLTITQIQPGNIKLVELVDENARVLPAVVSFFEEFSIAGLPENYAYPGMFGYAAYDAVRYFEDIDIPTGNTNFPDIRYDLYRHVVVIDHSKNEMRLISLTGPDEEYVDNNVLETILQNRNITPYPFKTITEEKSNCSDEFYLQAVEKGKAHCYRGDVFQVVLSRSFEVDFSGDDFNVYRALRFVNPSPYLFYFDYNNFRLFGSSPEVQLKISDKKATIHPIAGTYRRTGNEEQDNLLARALETDDKEVAEHIMLVDLARNDLSKHYQKINVPVYRKTEQYSHVIHLVSKVEGEEPVEDAHPLRILADTFPAGTLSGAPKYKAMSIIHDTEPNARGFYGGCIGFVGLDGTINTAIMIRSFFSAGNTLRYQAGAGITAASVPENELQEINNKIDALRKALKLANTYETTGN